VSLTLLKARTSVTSICVVLWRHTDTGSDCVTSNSLWMTAYRTLGNKLPSWNYRYYLAICLELLGITANIVVRIDRILTENWNRSLLNMTQGVRNSQNSKWQYSAEACRFFAPVRAYLRNPPFQRAPSTVSDCGDTHTHTHIHTHIYIYIYSDWTLQHSHWRPRSATVVQYRQMLSVCLSICRYTSLYKQLLAVTNVQSYRIHVYTLYLARLSLK
jgi:hypothetical protein